MLLFVFWTCGSGQRVRLGAEVFLEQNLDFLNNKRVGIICNHTSILPNGTHLIDTLSRQGINITAIFSPEHGAQGRIPAGEYISDSVDVKTKVPLYSLYGKTNKPTSEMLHNVDVLLFDLQDVGARFYTYLSTMVLAMEAAAENGKKFVVLDRPNPVNAVDVEGPVLSTALKSFVGILPIPIRHGMTVGELAKLAYGEFWSSGVLELTVIPMQGWKRTMWYDETGLPWVSPSPNIKTLSTTAVYPGTCLFEATNVSEGRGTEKPFEYIGAPWINGERLAGSLNKLDLAGVEFTPVQFTPLADPITAPNPKYKDTLCGGVYVDVIDRRIFRPVYTALVLLEEIKKSYPDKFRFMKQSFDRLAGTAAVRESLERGERIDSLLQSFEKKAKEFSKIREKYLLYDVVRIEKKTSPHEREQLR